MCFCRFNTSHVTLYHFSLEHLFIVWTRFNTSHVTLYPVNLSGFSSLEKFQYISCYSLSWTCRRSCSVRPWVSIHLMLLFISNFGAAWTTASSFNTSHVTLYRIVICDSCRWIQFQYISCYSLSRSKILWLFLYIVSIHLMLLFIPRFIGFSSSNSFYNTAKYKGLQDFYQPTYHFLFTHQNLI